MAESTFTLRVEDDLKAAFTEAARQQDQTGAQLIREYMRTVVQQSREKDAYEAWFAARVFQGLEAVAGGNVFSNEEVQADATAQRAELLARIRSVAQ